MKIRCHSLIVILLSLILSCSSDSVKQKTKNPVNSDPEWIIHVPKPWSLYKKGKQKNTLSFMLYRRRAIITPKRAKITPTCIITNEYIPASRSLHSLALAKQTSIITSMSKRGYTLKGRRDDILNDIITFLNVRESLGIAYDFTYDGNKKDYLAIAIYAKRNGHLLNVTFETTVDVYPVIRNEIKTIIKSIH